MLQLTSYDGGKGNLYQKFINLIPPHHTYIEPFLGGGAIMRHKRPARLNIGLDLDQRVIAHWSNAISDDTAESSALTIAPETPAEATMGAPIDRNGDGAGSACMTMEAHPAKNGDTEAKASTGRMNDTAESLVPPMLANLATNGEHREAAAIVKISDGAIIKSDGASWQFIQTDALPFLESYAFAGNEFVYADPPYLMSTRSNQRPLYLHEFHTEGEHEQLLTLLKRLPCQVMISGYWSELYSSRLSGWHTAVFTAYTRANKQVEEWVWMNYPEPTALHDYRYLGDGFRERERIKRKKGRWVNRLKQMNILERQALLSAIEEAGF